MRQVVEEFVQVRAIFPCSLLFPICMPSCFFLGMVLIPLTIALSFLLDCFLPQVVPLRCLVLLGQLYLECFLGGSPSLQLKHLLDLFDPPLLESIRAPRSGIQPSQQLPVFSFTHLSQLMKLQILLFPKIQLLQKRPLQTLFRFNRLTFRG